MRNYFGTLFRRHGSDRYDHRRDPVVRCFAGPRSVLGDHQDLRDGLRTHGLHQRRALLLIPSGSRGDPFREFGLEAP